VIIGAGIVGCALADELSVRGWTDVTVVDQGPLFATGGSSSHAPGLVFQTNAAKVMTEFAAYTVAKYQGLRDGSRACFTPVGGLELAVTEERLAELHRRHGWARAWGLSGARVLEPEQCAKLHPLVRLDAPGDPDEAARILGGLYIPDDGLADALGACRAQAAAAQRRGVVFRGGEEVLDVRVAGDRVAGVVTGEGEIPADVVVCCAGIWGPRIARMVGMGLPLTPLGHQLAWTDPVPGLAGAATEAAHPILRHQGADLYYRERFDRLGIGYYGHRAMPVDPDAIASVADADVMPSTMAFTPDDFAPALKETRALLPGTRDVELETGFNGLFSFTTDNMPLLGPSPDVHGFWTAEAVWITHSAGVARAMAEWLVDGVPSYDLHGCDVNRFTAHQLGPEYVEMRDCQNFVEVYDIIHPLQPMAEPRPLRTSPFHPREQELGAVFLEAQGWERPQWYEANADLVAAYDIPEPDPWAARYWSPIVGAEARATRERAALYDMSSLTRVEVDGPGALAYLGRMTTGKMDKSTGAVTYCLLLDERGRIRSDITVTRLGADRFQVGANGHLDVDRLARCAPPDVSVRDVTSGTCCVGLWGPLARDIMRPLTRLDLDALRYFRGARTYVGTVPVTALRVSYVGELGWELYTGADMGLKLWDTLWAAGAPYGLIAAGRGAFNSLRLEKGYRAYGTDMTAEHDPYEAGVGFAVKMASGPFVGRAALAGRAGPPERRLTCLDTGDAVVMGSEPVYDGAACAGYVTSAAYGYTVGHGVAYAWLPARLADPGTTVEIGYFDRRIAATVRSEPLFDPDMTRLRA
jgi:glycine cleavage system aminomethyltransferase T/glycine/D-amino acid oxidase-like deaminating enzyme